jgi:hypothetical protein
MHTNPLWQRLATRVQAKLSVSAPDDPFEREADQVAQQVLRMPEPVVQRSCSACATGVSPCSKCREEETLTIRRKTDDSGAMADVSVPESFISSLGPGQPLDTATRTFMEPRFGQSFQDVRLHTDAAADAAAQNIQARAFTLGHDIVFARGEYAPDSATGRKLLAHELTHTVQQGRGTGGSSLYLQRAVRDHVVTKFQPDPKRAQVCLVHLHGEERNALAVAQELQSRRCANLVHLDTTDRPITLDVSAAGADHVCTADPNRIFTDAGRKSTDPTLEKRAIQQCNDATTGAVTTADAAVHAAAEAELKTFADDVLGAEIGKCRGGSGTPPLKGNSPVFALHNNAGLSIKSWQKGGKYAATTETGGRLPAGAANPAIGRPGKTNDFFLVTDPKDFDTLRKTENVVLQSATPADDGSLSVALAGDRYINAEKEGRGYSEDKSSAAPDPKNPAARFVKPVKFRYPSSIYLDNYREGVTVLDMLGVREGPCPPVPPTVIEILLKVSSRGLLLGLLDVFLPGWNFKKPPRSPTLLPTDEPLLPRDTGAVAGDCRSFEKQTELDQRKDEWTQILGGMPRLSILSWVLGGPNAPPVAAVDEVKRQQECLFSAMKTAGVSFPTPAGGGKWPVKSERRGFIDQALIWQRKFHFTGAPFDSISAFARSKCGALIDPADVQWNPASVKHRRCWDQPKGSAKAGDPVLSDDEKAKEILMASSTPGVSRHHAGTDFDIGVDDQDLTPAAWTGSGAAKGRFADAWRWLAVNASRYGFYQPFDTHGSYGTGYMAERWHMSYYPIAQALLEFINANAAEIETELLRLWKESGSGSGGSSPGPEFAFIKTSWQSYLANVENEAIF